MDRAAAAAVAPGSAAAMTANAKITIAGVTKRFDGAAGER